MGGRAAQAQLRAFVRENAAPVDLATQHLSARASDLLDGLLEGRRAVLLGESDHFVHEKTLHRLTLLRHLVARGFRTIAEEFSFTDGLRVERYLATGDEACLARLTFHGDRSALRDDRDDTPTGVLRASWRPGAYPTAEFAADHRRFLAALRAMGVRRYRGFDVDTLPGLAYEDVAAVLAEAQSAGVSLAARLARVPGESLDAEIARLERVAAVLERPPEGLARALGTERLAAARRSLASLHDGLAWVKRAHPAPDYAALAPALAARERVMHRHLDALLDDLASGEGLVVMAHDFHLAKRGAEMASAAPGSGPGGGEVAPLGTHLHERLGDTVLGIWMLHGSGSDLQPFPDLPRTLRPAPGSVNEALYAAPGAHLLPTRAGSPFDRVRTVTHMYNDVASLNLARQTDVVSFVPEVGPLRACA